MTSAAVTAAMFGLGAWSFSVIRQSPFRGGHVRPPGTASRQPAALPQLHFGELEEALEEVARFFTRHLS